MEYKTYLIVNESANTLMKCQNDLVIKIIEQNGFDIYFPILIVIDGKLPGFEKYSCNLFNVEGG